MDWLYALLVGILGFGVGMRIERYLAHRYRMRLLGGAKTRAPEPWDRWVGR